MTTPQLIAAILCALTALSGCCWGIGFTFKNWVQPRPRDYVVNALGGSLFWLGCLALIGIVITLSFRATEAIVGFVLPFI